MLSIHRALAILTVCSAAAHTKGLAKKSESLQKVQIHGNGALDLKPQFGNDGSKQRIQIQMAPDEAVATSSLIRKADDGTSGEWVTSDSSGTPAAPNQGHKAPAKRSNLHSASLLLKRMGVWHGATPAIPIPGVKSTTMNSALVQAVLVFLGVGIILSIVVGCLGASSSAGGDQLLAEDERAHRENMNEGGSPDVEKTFVRRPEGLDEDLYGMGIASLIRDSQRFAMGTEMLGLRLGRLSISLLVLSFTMTLQVFLLYEMKHLVTSVSTHEARETYDKFEIAMYGNSTDSLTLTENGYHRGKDGYFDVSRFKGMPDDEKDSACQMPLSQPTFFIGILLVWTLVCISEVRRTMDLAVSLLFATPTIATMKESVQETPEDGDEAVIVIGLTMVVKMILGFFILLPRLLVSCLLLWLGCRWLTGTMGFSDVLQNAVTLEFILLLKDLFYKTMAPHHNKMETRNTLILPYSDRERPSSSVFLGAFFWGIISISFVILYIEVFQSVLPEYRWDIHAACADYLAGVETATPGS